MSSQMSPESGEGACLPDIVDEARRIIEAANSSGVCVRLLGGLAVRLHVPEPPHAALVREYNDIDLAIPKREGPATTALLESLGYKVDEEFNALNGRTRLLFHDFAHDRHIDVFVGAFELCHSIPLTDRLELDPISVPLAELLLTKLQVVQLNEKDQRDIVALIYYHDVGDHDDDTVNATHLASLCAQDWGLWRTCRGSMESVEANVENYDLDVAGKELVNTRLTQLWSTVEETPKSSRWRMRDRIGDRKRWYMDPEEID